MCSASSRSICSSRPTPWHDFGVRAPKGAWRKEAARLSPGLPLVGRTLGELNVSGCWVWYSIAWGTRTVSLLQSRIGGHQRPRRGDLVPQACGQARVARALHFRLHLDCAGLVAVLDTADHSSYCGAAQACKLLGRTSRLRPPLPDRGGDDRAAYIGAAWGRRGVKARSAARCRVVGCPMADWGRIQRAVALTSAESELPPRTKGATETMRLQHLLYGVGVPLPVTAYTDSSATRP